MDNLDDSPGGDWILHNYDAETTGGPDIDAELSRLQNLKTFRLLDQNPDESFNRLASVAARMYDAPIAIIHLVDLGRIWQVAASPGLSCSANYRDIKREMPRVTSLCAHTILQKELLLVVPNLMKDSRFRPTPWAKCGIRFYAGTPLISPEGAHIGTLCIMDCRPREMPFGEEQQEQLMDLAATVMDFMAERRQSQSSAAPDYPGFTFSYDVQRAATFLRYQLAQLKDDSDFQTVASDAHRYALQSAFDSADYLFASLVPHNQACNAPIISTSSHSHNHELPKKKKKREMPPSREGSFSGGGGSPKIGEHKLMDMGLFVRSLETAMEAFPRRVNLSFSVHPELPSELWFNDLKVFRSSIALLTSACERTHDGFVKLKIYPRQEGNNAQVVVFECEDTGRDVDLDRFDNLFQPPTDGVIDVGYEECIYINSDNGKIRQTHASCDYGRPNNNEPVSGGFAVHAVAEYVTSMGGKYGFRPRFVGTDTVGDAGTGSVFWFSIPLREATMAHITGTSALDGAIDSALEMSLPIANASNDIHRVDATAARPWF
ncbi:hypothetical protein ACA910_018196 [Epithemia clementina (nom. ined.)]